MWDTIVLVLQILFAVSRWVYGAKSDREKRAEEIVELLKKVTTEGDILAVQIHKEMLRQSNLGWDDIPIRDSDAK